MKLFIALTAVLAVASAGNIGLTAYGYPGFVHAHHVPVIGPNGVPVDEPAVAAAKTAHAAAHAEANTRNGDVAPYAYATYGAHFAAPVAVAAPAVYASHYTGPQHIPVIGANGVPVDEPAVSAARAHHAAAHVEANARNGDAAFVASVADAAGHYDAPVAHYTGPQHLPVIGANGVPVDEPAVSAARAHHAAAHVEAKVRNGDAAFVAAPVAAYATHVAVPVAAHGVPLDTPEVAAAKAAHYAAHVEAKVRNGAFHHYAPLVHYRKRRGFLHSAAPYAAYAAPVAHYAAPVVHYAGPQHIPVIGANGVPVDEPAVAVAKAEHAAAHVEAAARNGDVAHVAVATYAAHVDAPVTHYTGPQHIPVIGANGVPVDEPAVSAARAHHAAAHVEAQARNGDAAFVATVADAAGHYDAPVAHYTGPQHLPVIGANGVPVDEPAVSAARAHHAAAHVEAKVRNGDAAVVAPVAYAGHFGAPVAYAAGHVATPVVHYAGAHHVPVIGANGVPVDEPAVAVAKVAHAAAHVEAKARNGDFHHFVAAPVVHAW